jgi:proteic killer suppression protein
MEIVFKTSLLSDLYENKKVTEKEFRSNPKLVKQYVKTVNTLKSATKVEQLFQLKSLNYERLVGDRKGRCSVRINTQYRLLFEEISTNNIITVLGLEEISKHYE